ncbi:MAG: response regulator [Pirellulaceae bacterium]|nr:response regulator [Pirellulaceae bacterium]
MFVNAEEKDQVIHIVLIEDSRLDAKITIEALKNCGYHHRLALFRTASEAIEFLNKRGVYALAAKPQIILLDLFLPDSNGVSFLRMLRENQQLKDVPVVVLTGSEDCADREECEKLGISSYIVKPFNEEKFLSVMRQLNSLALALDAASTDPQVPSENAT